MDVSSLCRSCMKNVAAEEKHSDQNTVEMFTFCTNIGMSEEQLPRQFCSQCASSIQSCFSFITTARDVDLKLKHLIGSIKSEVPEMLHHRIKRENNGGSFIEVLVKVEDLEDNLHDNKDIESTGDLNSNPLIVTSAIHKYRCNMCSKSFVKKRNYDKHVLRHKNGAGNKEINMERNEAEESVDAGSEDLSQLYQCKHCSEKYPTSSALQHHKRQSHIRKKTLSSQQYTCNYCLKQFRQKCRLLIHLQTHDDSLKPYICDVCGSRFTHTSGLLLHQRVHQAEPFRCEDCDYTCRQMSNMRRHRRAHQNERKHQCVQCGRGFNEQATLNKHMLTHTGERPYKCPRCDSTYKSSNKRKQHLIRTHGMDPHNIPRMAKDGGPAKRYVTEETIWTKTTCLVADRVKKKQVMLEKQ